jgi:3-hydroxyacyl-[acyl-carrier-protein] dehydratase
VTLDQPWRPGDPLPRPEDVIPHRPPFLFVDEITEIVPDVSTSGRWTPSPDLPLFAGHFPGYPVLPGVLIIESLAQVGAVGALVAEGSEGDIPFFCGIDKARFKRQVRPGETVDLHVEVTQRSKRAGKAIGRATVDGELACQAGLFFMVVNQKDLAEG